MGLNAKHVATVQYATWPSGATALTVRLLLPQPAKKKKAKKKTTKKKK